jgi:hypothetical protein
MPVSCAEVSFAEINRLLIESACSGSCGDAAHARLLEYGELAVPALFAGVVDDNPVLSILSYRYLGQIRIPRVTSALTAMLRGAIAGDSRYMPESLVPALQNHIGEEAAINEIMQIARSGSPAALHNAVVALGATRSLHAIFPLMGMISDAPNERLGLAAAEKIGCILGMNYNMEVHISRKAMLRLIRLEICSCRRKSICLQKTDGGRDSQIVMHLIKNVELLILGEKPDVGDLRPPRKFMHNPSAQFPAQRNGRIGGLLKFPSKAKI